MGEHVDERRNWTVAHRYPHPRRPDTGLDPVAFLRCTNWQGTWAEAQEASRRLFTALARNVEPEVWYVPTREAELAGLVSLADIGNILVADDVRVPIIDRPYPLDLLAALTGDA